MPKAPITQLLQPSPKAVLSPDQEKEKSQALQLVTTLETEATSLILRSDEDYIYADQLLARAHQQRKGWGAIWKKIHEKAVAPLNDIIENLHSINRSIDLPYKKIEDELKRKMTVYTNQKALAAAQEQRIKQLEEDRLRREAEEVTRRAQAAATPQLAGRLQAKADRLAAQAEVVATTESTVTIPTGQASSTRKAMQATITDLDAYLVGVIEGHVPHDALLLDELNKELQRRYKAGELVMNWPGVTVAEVSNVVLK